ncbi:hypothetical protein [Paenibacillus sp. PvR148]
MESGRTGLEAAAARRRVRPGGLAGGAAVDGPAYSRLDRSRRGDAPEPGATRTFLSAAVQRQGSS